MKHFLILALLALASCANPVVERYDAKNYTDGIIFYRPAQYLLVDPDGKMSIINLPDHHEEYVMRITGEFGTADLHPSLQDGWNLTGIDLSSDKSSTVTTLLSGASSVAKFAPAFGFGQHLSPGLYKLDLDSNPPRLIGPLKVISKP